MFFTRSESARERVLLRIIESQQRTIENLNDRLAAALGQPWTLPPLPENTTVAPEWQQPDWTTAPDQAPVY